MRIRLSLALAGLLLSSCFLRTNEESEISERARNCGPAPAPQARTLPPVAIDRAVLDATSEPPRDDGGYLSMGIAYAPVKKVFDGLNTTLGSRLKNRGEAHITVITPVEFQSSLNGRISLGEAKRIAREMNMQAAKFEISCLGKGTLKQGRDALETYFLVVRSPELIAVRRRIAEAAGNPPGFKPEDFYPHITVGYTNRDLHVQDCVFKDESSCVADVTLQ